MKTTKTNLLKDKNEETKKLNLSNELIGSLKSVRPQKSMMRIRSLKPKRATMIRTVELNTFKK